MTTTTEAESPAVILRRAADYLQRYGWTYGIRYELPHPNDATPAADVVGAIRIAVAGRPVLDGYTDPTHATLIGRALGVLAAYLRLYQDCPVDAITDWNDSVPVNTGEATTTLRQAADWYERQTAAYAASYARQLLGSAVGR
jgi:hypothetical protein